MRSSLITATLGWFFASTGALVTPQKPLLAEAQESTFEIDALGIGFDLSNTYG
jgi:hypothetical protein